RTRQELRLPEVIDDLARKQNGLVVISGPTGTGKTTTFNYMLDLINTERYCKIITIEDPIEYTHTAKRSIVVQQEVLTDVADFQGALKHVLRQDPDVIGVGEMRDRETIYTTLIAAETGHLVIATLHTPNTIALVQRIVSVFSEGQQSEIRQILASCLQGVIAQQLLPHISGKSLLLNTEILIATTAVRAHIRDNDLHLIYSEMQTGSKHKMVTFDRSLLELYQKAEITYDTAINMALHPNSIKERMA
ncbi:MAG: ATPase, T2SS/T4P/T4SS family, partial [Planctomycetota bacterium]